MLDKPALYGFCTESWTYRFKEVSTAEEILASYRLRGLRGMNNAAYELAKHLIENEDADT